jgi:hypothetical protein
VAARLLGVIEERCKTGRNGAAWQTDRVHRLEAAGEPRRDALRRMTREYAELMHANEPVHSWPVD